MIARQLPPLCWPGYLSFLPKFLFRSDSARWRYILGATGLSILGNLILSGAAMLAFPDHAPAPEQDVGKVEIILGLVVFAPVVETALMAVLLSPLAKGLGAGPGVLISAILWGCLHGMASLRWGIAIWWSFLLFGIAFLTWSGRGGFGRGLFVATAIHATQNGCAVLLLLVAGTL